MSNTRTNAHEKEILSSSERKLIYDVLAREELDIASRYKLLKKYRLTDEGLQVLSSTLQYANKIKQESIKRVRHDPYDRSGYDDYAAKTKIPNRVIEDLEANIRMGKLVQIHPFWFNKNLVQHSDINNAPLQTHNINLKLN